MMMPLSGMKELQKFASVHNDFVLERNLVDRQTFEQCPAAARDEWRLAGRTAAAQGGSAP